MIMEGSDDFSADMSVLPEEKFGRKEYYYYSIYS